MPQHMALAVLADRLSPLRAQAPEDAGGVRDLIALNRQAADDKETAAIQDFLLDRFEAGSKAWNRKPGRSDVEDLCAADRCECGLDLRNVGFGKLVRPLVCARRLVRPIPGLMSVNVRQVDARWGNRSGIGLPPNGARRSLQPPIMAGAQPNSQTLQQGCG